MDSIYASHAERFVLRSGAQSAGGKLGVEKICTVFAYIGESVSIYPQTLTSLRTTVAAQEQRESMRKRNEWSSRTGQEGIAGGLHER